MLAREMMSQKEEQVEGVGGGTKQEMIDSTEKSAVLVAVPVGRNVYNKF